MARKYFWGPFVAIILLGAYGSGQADAGGPDVILIPGMHEPPELLVPPVALPNLSPAAKYLAELTSKDYDFMSPAGQVAVSKALERYPNFADGYVFRMGAHCKAADALSIKADLDAILENRSSLEASKDVRGFLFMRARIAHSLDDDRTALSDLDEAFKLELTGSPQFPDSGAVSAEKTANLCLWSDTEINAFLKKHPNDYRPYLLRALYHAFFARFSQTDGEREWIIEAPFADIDAAAAINSTIGHADFFKAVVFHQAYSLPLLSDYHPNAQGLRARYLALLDAAIASTPPTLWLFQQRAWMHSREARWQKAIDDYDESIALDPSDYGSLNDRAMAKEQLGKTGQAITDFTRAIEINPKDDLPLTYRATAYMEVGDWSEALSDTNKAISINLGRQAILVNAKQFRVLYPEYAAATDQALARKLGRTFFPNISDGDFAKGFLDPDRSWRWSSTLFDLYQQRIKILLRMHRWNDAMADYRRVDHNFPSEYGNLIDRWGEVLVRGNDHYYLDLKTYELSKANVARFWIKENAGLTNEISYNVAKMEIDCGKRSLRSLAANDYDNNGRVLRTYGSTSWAPVTPDTIGEIYADSACAK